MAKEPVIFCVVTDPEKPARLIQSHKLGQVKAYLLRDVGISRASPMTVSRLMGEGVKVEIAE